MKVLTIIIQDINGSGEYLSSKVKCELKDGQVIDRDYLYTLYSKASRDIEKLLWTRELNMFDKQRPEAI